MKFINGRLKSFLNDCITWIYEIYDKYIFVKDGELVWKNKIERGMALVAFSLILSSGYVAIFVLDSFGLLCAYNAEPVLWAVIVQLILGMVAIVLVDQARERGIKKWLNSILLKEVDELRKELKRCKIISIGMSTESPVVVSLTGVVGSIAVLFLKPNCLKNWETLVTVWGTINAAFVYFVLVVSNINCYKEMIIELEDILSDRAEQADSGTVLVVVSRSKEDKEVKQDVFTDEHKYLVKWQCY